jgi:hypothetical protein
MTYKQNWKEHLDRMNSDKEERKLWPAKEETETELRFLQNVHLPNCTASHPNTLKSAFWSSYKHSISENGSVLVIRYKGGALPTQLGPLDQ